MDEIAISPRPIERFAEVLDADQLSRFSAVMHAARQGLAGRTVWHRAAADLGNVHQGRFSPSSRGYHPDMATTRQKQAARQNVKKARSVQSARAHGKDVPRKSEGMSTAEQNRLPEQRFAFPEQRKMPIHDASHVRNAVARFDQVEDVSDADRDQAWKHIKQAAKKFDVDIREDDWRELFERGKVQR